ncbi:MAG: hypothetical protein V2I33_02600 [Kangiellaceae bacterium]|jgi:pyrrolidone-carboxylate peptidase|nr:hypothetical protein [Kangiellaceae bacterium]
MNIRQTKPILLTLVMATFSGVSFAKQSSNANRILYSAPSVHMVSVEEQRLPVARQAMPQQVRRWQEEVELFKRNWSQVSSFEAADKLVAETGLWLWQSAKTAMAEQLDWDDRPLYWTRLQVAKIIRTSSSRLSLTQKTKRLLLETLEQSSRGRTDLAFHSGAKINILLTGFDPFLLDRNIEQGNPSGVTALYLDGKRLSSNGVSAEINTVMVPVRWQDFDDGEIETLLESFYKDGSVSMIITVSQGRRQFDLERFPGRRRSAAAPGNLNGYAGVSRSNPLAGGLNGKQLDGPEFVEFNLPAAAMVKASGKYSIRDNRNVVTLEQGAMTPNSLSELNGLTAVSGSGGGYLSNEISYRSIRLRDLYQSPIITGHIHTPIVAPGDKQSMAAVVGQIVKMLELAIAEAK